MDYVELLSIHIPKTAGTSFYRILEQIYGDQVSISYKRRDVKPLLYNGVLNIAAPIRVMHGHFFYREVQQFKEAKVICWLRDPVDRVISNFHFFKDGLRNPERNPINYEHNKHRIDEDLLTYASRPENRNRMCEFLEGIAVEDLFFIGRQSHFEEDIKRLGRLLAWPHDILLPTLNKGRVQTALTDVNIRATISTLNNEDLVLYEKALELISIN